MDDFGGVSRRDVFVSGGRLAVFEIGEGPPALLLHGYPQSHRCWRRVAPSLAKTRRVIAPDWFGWGASERSLELAPRFEDEVERIGALLDALGHDRVDLITHDYGGLIGLGFTVARPERVSRLALINTRAHATMAPATYAQWFLLTWIARLPWLRSGFARLPWAALHHLALRRYVANGSFTREELEQDLAWMRGPERSWFTHFCRHFRVEAHPELAEGAKRIDIPVAIVWGDRDPFFPFAIAQELATLIPHATLTRIAGADHYVVEERSAEVAAALEALLAAPT